MKKRYSSLLLNILIYVTFIFFSLAINTFVYFTGGTSSSWAQLNYIPIIAASYLWDEKHSIIVAIILGLILGPYMPLDRSLGIMQEPRNWIFRLLIYVGIAFITGIIFKKNNHYEKIIKESYLRSHFNGLYNTNKLIPDLNTLMLKN